MKPKKIRIWDYLYGDEQRESLPAYIFTPPWSVPHGRYKDVVWARRIVTLYNAGVKYGFIPQYPRHPPPPRSLRRAKSSAFKQSSSKDDSVLPVSKDKCQGGPEGTVKARRRGSS